MPRMFDILRDKSNADKEKKSSPKTDNVTNPKDSQPDNPLNFPKAILSSSIAPDKPGAMVDDKKGENHFLVSKKLIAAVKKYGIDNQARSDEIYKDAVGIVKLLLEKIRYQQDISPYTGLINEVIDGIFNQLVLGDSILANIICDKEDGEYYLPYHIINVLVLSSLIGLNMGFNKSRLNHLGLTCIFYDIGLDAFRDIILSPKKIAEPEYKLIKMHIAKSLEVARKLNLNDTIKESISMHHERINGKGYPAALYDNEINSYAKIIALADTYEALTNDRPYRETHDGHKALRVILGSLKDSFDPDAIKVFINKMSVYPIGTIVKLSTQELARVVSVRSGSPLRPVVMILWDAAGKAIKERITIDLSKEEHSSILLQVYSKQP